MLFPELAEPIVVDQDRRNEVESRIEKGFRRCGEDLMLIGSGLYDMLNEGLYLDDYKTFAEYVDDMWRITEETAQRWIMAYRTASRVAEDQGIEVGKAIEGMTIAAAHALTKVPDGERGAIWSQAKEVSLTPSAELIKQIADEHRSLINKPEDMTKEEELAQLQAAERKIDVIDNVQLSTHWAKSMVRKWDGMAQKYSQAWAGDVPILESAFVKISEGVAELRQLAK